MQIVESDKTSKMTWTQVLPKILEIKVHLYQKDHQFQIVEPK